METRKQKSSVSALVIAMLAIIIVIAGGVVGSYVLTISQVNSQRNDRLQERVPACVLARQLVQQEPAGPHRATDAALYNATGCLTVMRVAG